MRWGKWWMSVEWNWGNGRTHSRTPNNTAIANHNWPPWRHPPHSGQTSDLTTNKPDAMSQRENSFYIEQWQKWYILAKGEETKRGHVLSQRYARRIIFYSLPTTHSLIYLIQIQYTTAPFSLHLNLKHWKITLLLFRFGQHVRIYGGGWTGSNPLQKENK